ncbi:MAG TPA: HPP family protein [Desulfobacteraceae bacterium]|nr:HPP family protein [Desulfobacteraceae bacterium]
MKTYFKKMAGGGQRPPKVSPYEILWSWAGAFLGIAPVAWLNYNLLPGTDFVYIIGSFGASAVLIYGAVRSPLAQPRNLLGGHLLSALVGVATYQLFHPFPWFAAAFSVATAIALMHATQTLHPPGGATALIAVIGSDKIHTLSFWYLVFPVGSGVIIMLAVALIVNNLAKKRKYPEFWL